MMKACKPKQGYHVLCKWMSNAMLKVSPSLRSVWGHKVALTVNQDLTALHSNSGYDAFCPVVNRSISTHSCQYILLTPEWEDFMCSLMYRAMQAACCFTTVMEWQLGLVRLSLMYLFDLLLHLTLDRKVLNKWSAAVVGTLSSHPAITEMFVSDLAVGTRGESKNWIRAYTVECTDEASRRTAQQIFASAIGMHLANSIKQPNRCREQEEWSSTVAAKDVDEIVSFISLLLDLLPQFENAWMNVCLFIKFLSNLDGVEGEYLRHSMIDKEIPHRLICLALGKDKSNTSSRSLLKLSYPSASLGSTVATTLTRRECCDNDGGRRQRNDSRFVLEVLAHFLGMTWCVTESVTSHMG